MIKPLIPAVCRLTASSASTEILKEIQQSLGWVPHVFEAAAHSPAALDILWRQATSGSRMTLSPRLREVVAQRMAELHGHGSSTQQCPASDDPKERAVLALVTKIVKDQGHHAGFVVEAARQIGVTDTEIIEVISLISFHTWAHYISFVANTDLDLPSLIDEEQECNRYERDGIRLQTVTNDEEQRS
jgi:hypothetical protein